jgi:hypothetical protein
MGTFGFLLTHMFHLLPNLALGEKKEGVDKLRKNELAGVMTFSRMFESLP